MSKATRTRGEWKTVERPYGNRNINAQAIGSQVTCIWKTKTTAIKQSANKTNNR